MQHNFYFGDRALGVSFYLLRVPGRLFVAAITLAPNALCWEIGVAGFVARLTTCAARLR